MSAEGKQVKDIVGSGAKRPVDGDAGGSPCKTVKKEYEECKGVVEEDGAAVNTIRYLSALTVGGAKSGHPGAPMGCAVVAQALFGHVMKFCGKQPDWPNRDRFVLSNGHASALLYVMLHLCSFDVNVSDLQAFRQLGSRTPGHPERHLTPGVEVSTGPLGQGLANAVGMAVARRAAQERFGKEILNHRVFALVGDGCLQEGPAQEAISFAGAQKLEGLVVIYDSNNITIDGPTNLSFHDDVAQRFEACHWKVRRIADGNTDLPAIVESVSNTDGLNAPLLVIVQTTIGYGSLRQGTAKVHGAPLASEDLDQLRVKCAWPTETNTWGGALPEAVATFYSRRNAQLEQTYEAWLGDYAKWAQAHPQLAEEFSRRFGPQTMVHDRSVASTAPSSNALASARTSSDGQAGECVLALSDAVAAALDDLEANVASDAPRNTSEVVLKRLATVMPELIGGSADLLESNKTDARTELGPTRYLHWGVREHGMCAMANGIAAYGCFRPFTATFFNFYAYAWGAVRLGALSELPVLHIATHDSIELGQDGPTHQPIELAALCRATPNLIFIRPGDAREVVGAYTVWLKSAKSPVMVALARGKVPNLPGTSAKAVSNGAYVLSDFDPADENAKTAKEKLILCSSGSELSVAVQTADLLRDRFNVRVVSMPSWRLFDQQPLEYRSSVFPPAVKAALMEPYSSYGIAARFDPSISVFMDTFGLSAPADPLRKHFGFHPQSWADKVLKNFP